MWFYENFIIKEPSVLVFKQKNSRIREPWVPVIQKHKKKCRFFRKELGGKKRWVFEICNFFGESWLYNKINFYENSI